MPDKTPEEYAAYAVAKSFSKVVEAHVYKMDAENIEKRETALENALKTFIQVIKSKGESLGPY